ncbi:NfeD family protein [Lacicoccus qingdaonensis]|uniref:NfeD-like C-terminal, partner-binding n=1 Tax=Lacicoccus qingdaonensis TaxID=576118 RepID=A0A1G9I8E7_9BACL|nr:NfeD family protein [Salinicoccus qingdaonensis]SDL21509.1 NfeD-like C-terminal, partner-binding [Salinicoccus qingdaonensis]
MAIIDTFLIGNIVNTFRDVITMPVIAFILLAVFIIGLVMQLFSEQFNFYGLLSIAAIILFFSGHLLIEGSNLLALSLFVLGAFLIIIEFFVIGTFLGILGVILLLLSIVLVSGNMIMYSIFLLIIIIIASFMVVGLIKSKKRKIPFLNRLILNEATDTESGYTSFDDRSHLVGETAITVTPLRPSGTIRYGEERIDAVAEGSFITADKKVKVIHVEGTRVVVRPIEE